MTATSPRSRAVARRLARESVTPRLGGVVLELPDTAPRPPHGKGTHAPSSASARQGADAC